MNNYERMLKEQYCQDNQINDKEDLEMALHKSEITEWEDQRYIGELEEKCEEQAYEIEELQEQLKKKDKKKTALKKECSGLKKKIIDLQNKNEKLQEKVKAGEKKVKKYKNGLERMKKERDIYKKKYKNANTVRQSYSRKEVIALLKAFDQQNTKSIPNKEKDIIDIEAFELE